jgi:hypothetical protein
MAHGAATEFQLTEKLERDIKNRFTKLPHRRGSEHDAIGAGEGEMRGYRLTRWPHIGGKQKKRSSSPRNFAF